MISSKIRCGIIGFGKMGKIRARTVEESGLGEVVQIYDVELPADVKYPVAKTALEIAESQAVDVVFVCTPNHLIPDLVIASLKAGKHVFAEKPPAFTAARVQDIIAAERENPGCKLMFGFNHRHHASIKRAKKMIEAGEFGRLLWMRGRYGKSVDAAFLKSWRAQKDQVGGGILLDQGIHMLDLFLHFAGDFDEVQAMVSNLFWKIDGIEDNVFAQFRNSQTGVAASLHSTMTQWRHLFSLEIFLEKGNILLHGLKTSSGSYGDEILTLAHNEDLPPVVRWGPDEQITYHTDTSWRSELDYFFDCIVRNHAVDLCNSADALRVMRIVDRIYQQR